MDPVLGQVIVAVLASVFGTGALTQLVSNRREKGHAPLDETAARLDIAKQLETERAARHAAEHERDEANGRTAAAGRERTAADRRAEAADRRANAAQHTADVWERHAADVREACLAHGTPLNLLPPRPTI